MRIKFWKATLDSVVILGGGLWITNDIENPWWNLGFVLVGALMLGSGVKWLVEDIER